MKKQYDIFEISIFRLQEDDMIRTSGDLGSTNDSNLLEPEWEHDNEDIW